MSISLQHVVIHGFDKEAHGPVGVLTVKERALDHSLPAVVSLVTSIVALLGKRANALTWGRFNEDLRGGKFQDSFCKNASALDNSTTFIQLSAVGVRELHNEAGKQNLATGGYVLFSVYTTGEDRYLLVAMIKQKGAIQLDENLIPKVITEIDLSKLHQAANIDLSAYAASASLTSADSDDEESKERPNYMSFLSQRRDSEAAAYFVSALGCTVGISPARATAKVFDAVNDFFSQPSLTIYRKAAREALVEYLEAQRQLEEPATIAGIEHTLTSVVSASDVGLMETVGEFLNGSKYQIPADFFVDKSSLRRHAKISLESDAINLKFNRSILGTDQNSQIYYNKVNKTLLIRNLPASFVNRLDDVVKEE